MGAQRRQGGDGKVKISHRVAKADTVLPWEHQYSKPSSGLIHQQRSAAIRVGLSERYSACETQPALGGHGASTVRPAMMHP